MVAQVRGVTSSRTHRPSLARRGGIGKGCLIAFAIFVVLLIGAGLFVAMKWKGWAADLAVNTTTAMVNQSDLPTDQKSKIIAKVTSVADDFKNGKVSKEQMIGVLQKVAESPLLPLGVVVGMEKGYITPNKDLTPEEKAAAKRSLQRFARGVFEKKIPMDKIEAVAAPISQKGVNVSAGSGSGGAKFKFKPANEVTTAEIKEFIANAKAEADKANMPDEAFEINVADEVSKAIDEGLKNPVK